MHTDKPSHYNHLLDKVFVLQTALTCSDMDWTSPLKTSSEILTAGPLISTSYVIKVLQSELVSPTHIISALKSLVSKATWWSCFHVPETIPVQLVLCGRVHCPAERCNCYSKRLFMYESTRSSMTLTHPGLITSPEWWHIHTLLSIIYKRRLIEPGDCSLT